MNFSGKCALMIGIVNDAKLVQHRDGFKWYYMLNSHGQNNALSGENKSMLLVCSGNLATDVLDRIAKGLCIVWCVCALVYTSSFS